jgi:hypothetical protein
MPKPFRIQEPIPMIALACPDASATDPWSIPALVPVVGAGWNIVTNTSTTVLACYDSEIDYSGLWLQELTAYVDMINEVESMPPTTKLLNNDTALMVITLISTTPFENPPDAASIAAGYPLATEDINQLMYRRVRGLSSNTSNTPLGGSGLPSTLWDTTIAGTNAFAVDKLYLRKFVGLYSFGVAFANGTEIAVFDSWVQGFGIQDKEPDAERFYRMQRNVRLFS